MTDYGVLRKIFDKLVIRLEEQTVHCDNVDSWVKPIKNGFLVPKNAKREHRSLAAVSRTPWLKLVVDNVAQAMYVDNIFNSEGEDGKLWGEWLANGMLSSQIANHRAMIAYGHSYGLVERATNSNSTAMVVVRFLSPRRCAVEYGQVGDWYPTEALIWLGSSDSGGYKMWALGKIFTVTRRESSKVEFVEIGAYKTVPVVRFANQIDLDGSITGEVEPFIPTASRINKTSFDRMLVQHYNSWKVKTATGIELPTRVDDDGDPTDDVDQVEADKLRVRLSNEDMLIAEDPNASFGVLDATSLDPFVSAWRSDIEALAAASQTPAHALTGQLVNLSAEALAAARAPLTQKVYERKINAGAAYANLLRLMAGVMGLESATDPRVRVSWQDVEVRSLSQAVDALGKASSMCQ